MCTGEWLDFENEEDQAEKVRRNTNKEFGGLILWCIEKDPISRPRMEEVIKALEPFKDIESELSK